MIFGTFLECFGRKKETKIKKFDDTMRIIVLFSSDSQKGIIIGLEQAGHSVVSFNYGLGSLSLLKRIVCKIRKKKLNKVVELFNSELRKIYNYQLRNRQDLLIILKGHDLIKESVLILEKINVTRIQWTIDSVIRWPGQAKLFPYMDKVFFQDGADVGLHFNSEWLPLGFDSNLFVYQEVKNIDILLLGNLQQPYYKKRRDCFKRLASFAKKGYKVYFVGSFLDNELLSIFKSSGVKIYGRLSIKKYSQVVSHSKICVNIHQDDGGKAVNPMFFAIPATGSLQLTDNSIYLEEWLQSYRHFFPTSPETICDDVRSLLSRRQLSKDIALEVSERHSYYARANKLMGIAQ